MKKKSLVRQTQEQLNRMVSYGTSKHTDKKQNNGKPALDKIYSYSTRKNYLSASVAFSRYVSARYECRTLAEARVYVAEYLQHRIDSGLSAWTVRRDAAALAKLFQCATYDFGVALPVRHRAEITQHRTGASQGHFSYEKNADLVELCRATGLRRHEVRQLRVDDVAIHKTGVLLVHVRQGKGGKPRYIIPLDDTPLRLANKARAEGREYVIEHVPKYAPCHGLRREFARELYDRIARDPATLPRKQCYYCRGDLAGTVYDRRAMYRVSRMLGHRRLNVIASHYLN